MTLGQTAPVAMRLWALNLGATGGAKDAKCAIAGRDDQYVRVARNVMAERRSDMEHIVATRDCGVPSCVA
jgi:hypothetical protein